MEDISFQYILSQGFTVMLYSDKRLLKEQENNTGQQKDWPVTRNEKDPFKFTFKLRAWSGPIMKAYHSHKTAT